MKPVMNNLLDVYYSSKYDKHTDQLIITALIVGGFLGTIAGSMITFFIIG